MDTGVLEKVASTEHLLNIVCKGMTEPKIAVIGVGGAGNNIVNNIHGGCKKNVRTIAINTDEGSLQRVNAHTKLLVGKDVTQGKGTNGFPEVGEYCAECAKKAIQEAVIGNDIAFVVAGMGGGTGTGIAPVVAKIAKEQRCLTFIIAINPFSFERERSEKAKMGIKKLKEIDRNAVVLENDLLLKVAENKPVGQAFEVIDRNVIKIIDSFCNQVNYTFISQFTQEINQWVQEKAPAPAVHEEPEIVVSSKPMVTCEASMTSMMPKGQLPQ